MPDKATSQIILEQEIAKVEEELASAFAARPPSIKRRVELDGMLERLNRKMASAAGGAPNTGRVPAVPTTIIPRRPAMKT